MGIALVEEGVKEATFGGILLGGGIGILGGAALGVGKSKKSQRLNEQRH